MQKKLIVIGVMVILGQALATYTSDTGWYCVPCSNSPYGKKVRQVWVYEYQGGPLISKTYQSSLCGAC